MWYLAILAAFGVSLVNGQLTRLDCTLTTFPTSRFLGAFTTTTASFIQSEICRCFDNNPAFLQDDRFVVQAFDPRTPTTRTTIYNATVAELCSPAFRESGFRIVFPAGSSIFGTIGFISRNGVLIADTAASTITLRTPQAYQAIDNNITHSASMIAITSILPILFALLLAMFTSMLFMSCCCCQVFTPTKCQQDS